ncbi:MAG: helicase-exonuclease AddAB subunit AddA [Verrucomicrobia bacterium]|nr:helicase-exonuclease AddAB subunit AddA [Verrucomicrobiota bacterium]
MSAPTPSQHRAVAARGNVLVSAGAGTGKTHTVVERCLRLVLDEGVSLDRILMVTFTEAAAAEMRRRLREALHEKLDAPGADASRIAQQIALLDTANISTLHGFCLRLVREHFHELAIDPDVAVLDDAQTRPLISSTLDELLERHYAGDSTESRAVHELVRRLGRGSDESIRELIRRIHAFTQTLPDPARWLEEQIAAFSEAQPGRWRVRFVECVVEWTGLWRDALAPHLENVNVKASAEALVKMPENTAFSDALAVLHAVVAADQNENGWKKVKGKHRAPIEDFFDDAARLLSLVESSSGTDPLQHDWDWTRPHVLALLRLAREFGDAFTRAKRELGGVDFADQEQLALRLLRDPTIARHWRARLDHVFVDECQDINAAQDAILRALSRDGAEANRFLVGDVKQSIYRFRLADPAIFAGYERAWNTSDDGERIPLSDNFRSHEALLRFVNTFFAPLLRARVGGVDYADDAHLQFGNRGGREHFSHAKDSAPRVELHLLPHKLGSAENTENGGEGAPELADLPAVHREARLIAQRLASLQREGLQVWDKDVEKFRPVEWRDMVVLLRAPRSKVETFAQEFHAAGVPLLAARGGFFDAQEVVDLLSLLRVLDNPYQDIPLLAVLRSPLVGMTLEELVEVRAGRRQMPMWEALRKNSEGAECDLPASAREKTAWFLSHFAQWRSLLRHASLTDCLETALAETHYEALLLAGERGAERAANVRRLLDLARQFDPWQRQGLFRFLRFIEAQQDEEVDREPAAPSAQNAVRLMSIHQSKGLEFPVVVVADLGKNFNILDLRAEIILDEQFGLCPQVRPPRKHARYPSIAHWLARSLGEELRLLYVAFTRARDRLILTGTLSKMSEEREEKLWQPESNPAVSDAELLKASRPMDWILSWLRRYATAAEGLGARDGANALLRWMRHDEESLAHLAEALNRSRRGDEADPSDSEQFRLLTSAATTDGLARLTWNYPHDTATREPAKTSVSALRRRVADADEEAREWPVADGFRIQDSGFSAESSRANLAGELSAAERGTAHHIFQQRVALECTGSSVELRAEAERLQRIGALTLAEAAALDFDALAGFWSSEVGRKILAHRACVRRELPFTVRFNKADLKEFPTLALNDALPVDEFVVVQGKVDLAVLLEREVWLLDFKTDHFAPAKLAAKVEEHSQQLRLYALALERIYGRTVTTKWLHFFAVGKTASVP